MREILFRGQTRRRGEKVHMDGTPVESNWVYGGIFQGENRSVIYGYDPIEKHVVYSDTVGQYTGLKDRNGKRIFEGDIVRYYSTYREEFTGENCVVEYGVYNCSCCDGVYGWEFKGGDIRIDECYEIIGNIHDNPELLKEDEKDENA